MSYTKLESLILQTLSFYEPMNLAKIIMSFDDESLKEHPHFCQNDLEELLKQLKKRGLVRYTKKGGQKLWLRVPPTHSYLKKLCRFFGFYY